MQKLKRSTLFYYSLTDLPIAMSLFPVVVFIPRFYASDVGVSLAMVGTMTTAALVNNADNGFWSASKGWELNLYLMVIPVAVVIAGPGRWSVDHAIGLADLVPVPVAGAAVGAIVAVVGVAAGWTRWATRDA